MSGNMSGTLISIHAEDLRRTDRRIAQMNLEATRIGRDISNRIGECYRNNSPHLSYDLPFNWDIPGISMDDAQLYIYSRLIEDLRRNNFEVKYIAMEDAETRIIPPRLIVRWVMVVPQEQKEAMRRVLRDHASGTGSVTPRSTPEGSRLPAPSP